MELTLLIDLLRPSSKEQDLPLHKLACGVKYFIDEACLKTLAT